MSDASQGPGWWKASDDKWYSPEQHPDFVPPAAAPAEPPPVAPPTMPTPPVAMPPAAAPPAYTPPVTTPPAGDPFAAPYGSPPGAPGAPGFGGVAGAAPTYPQPGYGQTMAGGPVPPGGEKKGNGGKIAIIAIIVVLLLGIIGAGALILGGGGDDDKDVAAESSTTTTEDKEESTPRTLVERTTTTEDEEATTTTEEVVTFDSPVLDGIDDATATCVGEAALADPTLSDALSSGADMDPASAEFATLIGIITGCGGRGFLEEQFMGGVSGGGQLSPEQVSCVEITLSAFTDEQFLEVIIRLANGDTTVIAEQFGICEG